MAEHTVFLILTALIRNFYKLLMQDGGIKVFGQKPTSRVKAFVFRLIAVPAKWIILDSAIKQISMNLIQAFSPPNKVRMSIPHPYGMGLNNSGFHPFRVMVMRVTRRIMYPA